MQKRNPRTKRKNSKSGTIFLGCSNYPMCDYAIKHIEVLDHNKVCPNCGGFMIKRKGRYGPFYGCSNFPLCKYTMKITSVSPLK